MTPLTHVAGPLYRDSDGVEWSFANPYRPVRTRNPGDRYIPEPVRPGCGKQPVAAGERASAVLLRRLVDEARPLAQMGDH